MRTYDLVDSIEKPRSRDSSGTPLQQLWASLAVNDGLLGNLPLSIFRFSFSHFLCRTKKIAILNPKTRVKAIIVYILLVQHRYSDY